MVSRVARRRACCAITSRRCLVLARDAHTVGEALRDRAIEVLPQPARITELVDAVQRTADRP